MCTIIFESTHWTSEREMQKRNNGNIINNSNNGPRRKTNDCAKVSTIYLHIRTSRICKRSRSNRHCAHKTNDRGKNMHRNIISQILCTNEQTNNQQEKMYMLICINDMYDLFNINFQWQTTHTYALSLALCFSATWSSTLYISSVRWTIITFGSQCNIELFVWGARHFAATVVAHPRARSLVRLLIHTYLFINSRHFWHFAEHWRMANAMAS